MAVAFDAVSSATPTAGTTSPHTWTHTGVGSSLAVVAAICLDEATSGTTVACTYGGVSMTLIGQSAANNANNGILYFFGIANAPTGAQTVSFTFSGTTDVCVGASVSWTGAATTFGGAFGNLQPVPVTGGEGLAANPALSITCHSTNSQAFCVIASGASAITSMGGGAQRFLDANTSAGNCGSIVGSNAAGINGNINFTSVIASGSYAIAGLEILPPAAPLAYPPAEAPGRKAPSAFRFRRPFFVLPPAGNPKMATLIDGFGTNDLATLWGTSVGTVTWYAAGQIAIRVDTGYSSQLISTGNTYDLTSSSIYMRVIPYVQGSSATTLQLTTNGTGQNGMFCGQSGGNFTVYNIIAGVQTNLSNTTWNATNMAWWQIIESAGTVSFQYAPDAGGVPGSWTTAYSAADSTFTGTTFTSMNAAVVCGDFGSDPVGTSYILAVNTSASVGAALEPGFAAGIGTTQTPIAPRYTLVASGTGAAGNVAQPVLAQLATGIGTSFAGGMGITVGLANAVGAAGTPVTGFNAGLATGTGTSQPVTAGNRTIGLASGVGSANSPPSAFNAGLATGVGTAFNVTVGATGLTITAGLATGTGSAGTPVTGFNAALAAGVGTSQQPSIEITVGLATATGTAEVQVTGFNVGVATAAGAAGEPIQGAGLATAAGTAFAPSIEITVGLATGAGSAGTPVAPRTAGLATGVGAAFAPAVGLTPGLPTGSGQAGNVAQPVLAGLATGVGSSFAPAVGITISLASGTGAAGTPVTGFNAGLATGIGVAQGVAAGQRAIGLAAGTGSCTSPVTGFNAGLATGVGTAFNITFTTGIAILAGLASGTGVAQIPAVGITVGLASASGTAGNVAQPVNAGLATGTGTSQPVTAGQRAIGLATATGTAQIPAVGITIGLATALGTNNASRLASAFNAGQAVALGVAQVPGVGIGQSLASAAGVSQPPTVQAPVRQPLALGGTAVGQFVLGGTAATVANNYGGTVTPVTIDAQLTLLNYGGTVQTVDTLGGTVSSLSGSYGGTCTLLNYGGGITLLAYGGTITLLNYGGTAATTANTYGGTVTTVDTLGGTAVPATIDGAITLPNLGGTCASQANTYGGTVGVVTYDASLVGWTMQVVALTLAENNDETVNVAITSSGSALNLTGATINMYLKTAAGTPDGSALLLSSAGGSPAITITSTSGGLCTVAIPRADLTAETNNFYRIDVVFSGLQNTAIYGAITWITL